MMHNFKKSSIALDKNRTEHINLDRLNYAYEMQVQLSFYSKFIFKIFTQKILQRVNYIF